MYPQKLLHITPKERLMPLFIKYLFYFKFFCKPKK